MKITPAAERAIATQLRAAGCVFAEAEAALLADAATSQPALATMVQARVGGRPLEYIVGWAEFCGLRVAVSPGVFVPRRRTELLARHAIAMTLPGSVVVDLCCGTGAVAAAVAAAVSDLQLYAADLDPAAVACARRNLDPLGAHVVEGDLFAPLPAILRGRIDVLVVNAPYVPSDAIRLLPPEARDFEHRIALDGGSDGLDLHRRIAAEASAWLAPAGHLLLEASARQAPQSLAALTASGLSARAVVADSVDEDEDDTTVVIAQRRH